MTRQLVIVHPEYFLDKLEDEGYGELVAYANPDQTYLVEQFATSRVLTEGLISELGIPEKNITFSPLGWLNPNGKNARQGQSKEHDSKTALIYRRIIDGDTEVVLVGQFLGNRFFMDSEYGGYNTNGCLGRALIDLLEASSDINLCIPNKYVKMNSDILKPEDLSFEGYVVDKGYNCIEVEDGLRLERDKSL